MCTSMLFVGLFTTACSVHVQEWPQNNLSFKKRSALVAKAVKFSKGKILQH